jgi:menaquinone-dependent protoporphyrinogen oxidase
MKAQIVYGTRNGGTAGLAHMMASGFERAGWKAEVCDVASRPGIGDVDVVVVGGALYVGRWPAPLRAWVRHHLPTLRRVPVWFFSSGPLDDSARRGDIAPTPSVARLAAQVEITGFMTFGGRLEAHPRGWVARQMAKKSSGDWRDPTHVDEWIDQIVRHTSVLASLPEPREQPLDPSRSVDHPGEHAGQPSSSAVGPR